jgi:hypothetical protein
METVYVLLVVLSAGLIATTVMAMGQSNKIDDLRDTVNIFYKRENFLDNQITSGLAVHAGRIDKLSTEFNLMSIYSDQMEKKFNEQKNNNEMRVSAIIDELDNVKAQYREHLSLTHSIDKELSDFQQDYSQQTFESTVMHDNLNKKVVGVVGILHEHIAEMHTKTVNSTKKPIKKAIIKKPKNK